MVMCSTLVFPWEWHRIIPASGFRFGNLELGLRRRNFSFQVISLLSKDFCSGKFVFKANLIFFKGKCFSSTLSRDGCIFAFWVTR